MRVERSADDVIRVKNHLRNDIDDLKEDFRSMQPKKTTGLIISLHKTLFDGTFDTMALLQDQAAEFNDGWIRRIGVFPQTNPSLKQWHVILKKGRSEFKRLVDSQFSNMESFWMTAETSRSLSARGPSAANPDEGQASA
jgi:hypothetical protein